MFVDVADLPRAVAERTVDAQENPLTNLVNFNLQAHHKHVSLTGHLLGIALLLVNRARYDALPANCAACSTTRPAKAQITQRALAIAEDAECLGLLADAGVTVIGPGAIDLPAFRAAVATRPG